MNKISLYIKSATVTSLLFVSGGYFSRAQTAEDAFIFGENNYLGSARTMAMGNAFTALGGDLGSITINPAGSASIGYTVINISAGFDHGGSKTVASNAYNQSVTYAGRAAFRLPNIGFSFNFNTGNGPLSGVTLAFTSNVSNSYTEQSSTGGRNSQSSFFRSIANTATNWGISAEELDKTHCYDNYPFDICLGYKTFLISPVQGENSVYAATTETADETTKKISLRDGGELQQNWGRDITGYKNDYVFNLGFNFSEKLFFGANLGLTTLNRAYEDYFKEAAVDYRKYDCTFYHKDGSKVDTYWKDGKYSYWINASGIGVYGKFGVLYVPVPWLRLGAAIQTGTTLNINENYGASSSSTFTNSLFSSNESTGNYSNRYKLITPMRANFGIAGVIAGRVTLSADYELCPYGAMKFRNEKFSNADSEWDEVNQAIRDTYDIGHILRFGAEARINNALSVRAGYILNSNPVKLGIDSKNGLKVNHFVNWGKYGENTFSFGIGYNSKGSFYADVAAMARVRPTLFVYPYEDVNGGDGIERAPEYVISRTLWTAALTVGWRF